MHVTDTTTNPEISSDLKAELEPMPNELNNCSNRIALVLDMDECLVHTRFASDDNYRQIEDRPEDEGDFQDCFEIFMEDGEKAVVYKRPGLDKFLEVASKHFDLYIFTAGLSIYGEPVIDALDPKKDLFKDRFYRDSCQLKKGFFLKDLRIVRPDLSRVVLVDNNPVSFLPQPSNGIPVPSFYNDPNDRTLEALIKVLMNIYELDDVRPRLHRMFHLNDLLEEHRTAVMTA